MKENHSVLEDIKFTSDSDYCHGSDKRKSKKQGTKMNPKSKKHKNSKSTEKNVQTINLMGSTIISSKESDSIKNIITTSSINAESLKSMNVNKNTEESRVNKCLNKSIKNSTVFNNSLNNDHLISEKYDSVNENIHLNVARTKQLPPIKLERPYNSSLTSANHVINSKNQPSQMTSIFMSQTKKEEGMKSTQNFVQPILEPKQIVDDKHEIYGMF